MRVIVTGASGLLGYQVVQAVRQAGHEPVPLYHTQAPWADEPQAEAWLPCDLTDETAWLALLDRLPGPPHAIVHCAALTDVDACERNKAQAYAANVLATRHVARGAQRAGARVIYISTASVFSGFRGGYAEHETPEPPNFYALTKVIGEEIALAGGPNLVVRATILGVHPRARAAKNLIEWLVGTVRQDGNLRLFADVRINPISHITLAGMLITLLAYRGPLRVLHLGSLDVVSKAAVGRWVVEQFPGYGGHIEEVSVQDGGLAAMRPKEMWLDTRRTSRELGLSMPAAREEVDRVLHRAGLAGAGIA